MRATIAILLLAILVPLATGGRTTDTYVSAASTCSFVAWVPSGPSLPCPNVRQSGQIDVLGCTGAPPRPLCGVRAEGTVTGNGLPAVPKYVKSEILSGDGRTSSSLMCEASSLATTATTLACTGVGNMFFPLAVGECALLRLHAEFLDLGPSAPALSVQTEIAYSLCRDSPGTTSVTRT